MWWQAQGRKATVSPTMQLEAHQNTVTAVVFSPNGEGELIQCLGQSLFLSFVWTHEHLAGLATCASSGNLRLWAWSKAECVFNVSSAHSTRISHITFSMDGLRIATASADHSIKVIHNDAPSMMSLSVCVCHAGVGCEHF